MTIVFGRLVNDFNDWGRGAAAPDQLQSAINENAYVFQPSINNPSHGLHFSMQAVVCLSLYCQIQC
jgi:hypothetical protein